MVMMTITIKHKKAEEAERTCALAEKLVHLIVSYLKATIISGYNLANLALRYLNAKLSAR